LRYQWRKDGNVLENATNEVLTIPSVGPDDSGLYAVVVTDDIGSTISDGATLTVLLQPVIIQPPVGQMIIPGSTVTFSVTVTNGATLPVSYRWRTNRILMPAGFGFSTQNVRTAFITFTNMRPPFTNVSVVVANVAQTGGRLSTEAIMTYVTDNDNDGMADAWEAAWGFNTNDLNDASLDFDHDTMSNRAEFIAGTDPTDPQSYLKVEPVSGSSSKTISFVAVSNRTYTVEFSDTLATWQRFGDVGAYPTNRIATLVDTNGVGRFYRLATPRQP